MAKLYVAEYLDWKEFHNGFLEVLDSKQVALYDITGLLIEKAYAHFTDMQTGMEIGEYHDGDHLMRDALIINYVMRPRKLPYVGED